MAEARVVESAPVVVDRHRAVSNLVETVAVDIGHAQVVVALSGIAVPLRLIGVEGPAVLQFSSVPVPGGNDAAGIVATAEDGRREPPTEIGDGGEVAFGAVAIVIAPATQVAPLGNVWLGVHDRAGESVEDAEILWPAQDAAYVATALVAAMVGSRVTDDAAKSVARSVGSLHHQLGASVAVEVIDHELRIVGTGTDVPS